MVPGAPLEYPTSSGQVRVLVAYPDGTVIAAEPRLLKAAPDELGITCVGTELASSRIKPKEWPTLMPVRAHELHSEHNSCAPSAHTRGKARTTPWPERAALDLTLARRLLHNTLSPTAHMNECRVTRPSVLRRWPF